MAEDKGILGEPNPDRGKSLSKEVENRVHSFYRSKEVSRMMPGKKDTVNVIKDGVKVKEQKHLILCNLWEAFNLFKENNPDVNIGFSKFCKLRPKECVLVGSSGTHSVCVCTTHENMKLMFSGAGINKLKFDKNSS